MIAAQNEGYSTRLNFVIDIPVLTIVPFLCNPFRLGLCGAGIPEPEPDHGTAANVGGSQPLQSLRAGGRDHLPSSSVYKLSEESGGA